MEKLIFNANYIQNEVFDDEILVVGFHNDMNYLLLQLALEFDEQDIRLGMNTYHIERDDQSYGNYGGVDKVLLKKNHIQFVLNEKGKKNLKCSEVSIDFQADEDEFSALQGSLHNIFGNMLEIQ